MPIKRSVMEVSRNENIKIVNTTDADINTIFWLFEQAMELQGKNGYKVWEGIDKTSLQKDIDEKLQYKIVKDSEILCIFSIQYNDPFIWRGRDQNDAIYLHRIVVNPDFKGQKQFQRVLNWAKGFARQNNLNFVRMDTWADNLKIIDYYKSFGFKFIENYRTLDAMELPIQNRNLNVALLEMKLVYD
jgi:ribosomal protein S18 acetylase RimI-like enzyme